MRDGFIMQAGTFANQPDISLMKRGHKMLPAKRLNTANQTAF